MNPAESALRTLLWSEPECDDIEDPHQLVTHQLRQRVASDWASFRAQAERLGFDATRHCLRAIDAAEGDAWDYAAHDFILTRNHHGVGFWENDRWQRPWGDTLTVLCNLAGEIDIYLGDDGLLYPE